MNRAVAGRDEAVEEHRHDAGVSRRAQPSARLDVWEPNDHHRESDELREKPRSGDRADMKVSFAAPRLADIRSVNLPLTGVLPKSPACHPERQRGIWEGGARKKSSLSRRTPANIDQFSRRPTTQIPR